VLPGVDFEQGWAFYGLFALKPRGIRSDIRMERRPEADSPCEGSAFG